MSRSRFCRVETEPGKHGPLDVKVTFCGKAPTHAETIYMLGAKLLAEDRYEYGYKRELLLAWVGEVSKVKSFEELAELAYQCQEDRDGSRAKEMIRARVQPTLFDACAVKG